MILASWNFLYESQNNSVAFPENQIGVTGLFLFFQAPQNLYSGTALKDGGCCLQYNNHLFSHPGILRPVNWNIDVQYQNRQGKTPDIYLASKGITNEN